MIRSKVISYFVFHSYDSIEEQNSFGYFLDCLNLLWAPLFVHQDVLLRKSFVINNLFLQELHILTILGRIYNESWEAKHCCCCYWWWLYIHLSPLYILLLVCDYFQVFWWLSPHFHPLSSCLIVSPLKGRILMQHNFTLSTYV